MSPPECEVNRGKVQMNEHVGQHGHCIEVCGVNQHARGELSCAIEKVEHGKEDRDNHPGNPQYLLLDINKCARTLRTGSSSHPCQPGVGLEDEEEAEENPEPYPMLLVGLTEEGQIDELSQTSWVRQPIRTRRLRDGRPSVVQQRIAEEEMLEETVLEHKPV